MGFLKDKGLRRMENQNWNWLELNRLENILNAELENVNVIGVDEMHENFDELVK